MATINKQIVEAMKAKDEIRLSTLKLLSSALHNAKIDKRGDLTKEEELTVVRREAKKRKDAIEAYKKVGADKRAEREEKELLVLQEFLPEEFSDEEILKFVFRVDQNCDRTFIDQINIHHGSENPFLYPQSPSP